MHEIALMSLNPLLISSNVFRESFQSLTQFKYMAAIFDFLGKVLRNTYDATNHLQSNLKVPKTSIN